jgi:adenosylhomocysteine nucleosidase
VILGIVVALPEELSTLTSKRIDKGCCLFIADKVLVAYSGAGEQNAKKAAEQLIAKGASHLISWGCAAALDTSLKPGDLTLADALIDSDNIKLDIHSSWHRLAAAHLQSSSVAVHIGSLAESQVIVSSSTDKTKLHATTGAIALDMESVAVAKVALSKNLPFLAVRAVVDPVNMNLPKAIMHSLNDQGDVVLSKLLLFLLTHPFELPGLIKLGLYFNKAKSKLRMVAQQLDTIASFGLASTST